jgi:hypothetical protein
MPVFTAGLLTHETNIVPAKHQRFWYKIFKDSSWLDFVVQKGADPGLLGSGVNDNSSETARYLILLIHKDRMVPFDESKSLFFQSIRPYSASDDSRSEIVVGGIQLNIRELRRRPILIPDTMKPDKFGYFFYNDSRRSLRLIKPTSIVSQNGEVFCLKLPYVARQKQRNIDRILDEGEEHFEEREQMYQVLIYSRSLRRSYHVRLGDRLPALEDTKYMREIIRLEWSAHRSENIEWNFATVHPDDFVLLRS